MLRLNVPFDPMFFWPPFTNVALRRPGKYREKSTSNAYCHLSDPKFRFMNIVMNHGKESGSSH